MATLGATCAIHAMLKHAYLATQKHASSATLCATSATAAMKRAASCVTLNHAKSVTLCATHVNATRATCATNATKKAARNAMWSRASNATTVAIHARVATPVNSATASNAWRARPAILVIRVIPVIHVKCATETNVFRLATSAINAIGVIRATSVTRSCARFAMRKRAYRAISAIHCANSAIAIHANRTCAKVVRLAITHARHANPITHARHANRTCAKYVNHAKYATVSRAWLATCANSL